MADQHRFPPDFASVEAACDLVSMLMATPGIHDVLAEEDHRIVGLIFIDLRTRIGGVGPLAVDPEAQNRGLGKALMHAAMEVAVHEKTEGIRLVRAAYHNCSLALYTKLGFETREQLSVMQGLPLNCDYRDMRFAVPPSVISKHAICFVRKFMGLIVPLN